MFVVTKTRDGGLEKQAGIAIKGEEVLFGIPSVAHACTYTLWALFIQIN